MGPVCILIRRFFNWIAATLAMISTALDILYLGKAQFYSQGTYIGLALVWTARLILCCCLGIYYFNSQVLNYRPKMSGTGTRPDDEQEERDETGKNEADPEELKVRT